MQCHYKEDTVITVLPLDTLRVVTMATKVTLVLCLGTCIVQYGQDMARMLEVDRNSQLYMADFIKKLNNFQVTK